MTAATPAPRVSIVILSYARPAMLAESVRAARAQGYASREIIVVDNESAHSDAIAAMVAAHGDVRHVRTGANLGFATGMNVGLREAGGELVLMTEDDMVLAPDAVERFVRAHDASEGPALFSGVIRDRDSGTIWYAGGDLAMTGVLRLHLPHRGEATLAAAPVFPTDYLTGAFVFGSAALLRSLDGYRDDFFMYWEDVELSLRAVRRGIALRVVSAAEATHFTPVPGSVSAEVAFHKVKNLLATYLLHGPLRVLPAALARYGLADMARAMVRRRGARTRARALAWIVANSARLLRDRRRVEAGGPSRH